MRRACQTVAHGIVRPFAVFSGTGRACVMRRIATCAHAARVAVSGPDGESPRHHAQSAAAERRACGDALSNPCRMGDGRCTPGRACDGKSHVCLQLKRCGCQSC